MASHEIAEEISASSLLLGLSPTDIAVLVVSVMIALIAIILISRFRSAIVAEIEAAKASITKENVGILKAVTDNLSPRIVHCSSETDVAREANSMIRAAIQAKGNENLQGGFTATSNVETPFVTFYGAADLGTPQTDGLTVEELKHFEEFDELMLEAVNDDVRVRRHINLFSNPELKKRTKGAQAQYVKWLIARYDFVYSNPSFELINNPRVPQWGASFSSLITNDAILEIKANGLSGIAIYNSLISRSVRESLKRARKMAASDRIITIKSSDKNSVNDFYELIMSAVTTCGINIQELDEDGSLFFYKTGSQFEKMMKKMSQDG